MKVAETRVTRGYITTVPKPVREALGLGEGSVIEWHIEGEKIVVKRKV